MFKKMFISVILVLFSVSIFSQSISSQNLEPVFKTVDEKIVVGYLSLIDLECNLIPNLWMKFLQESYGIQNVVNPEIYYGVSFDNDEETGVFFHLVGVEVSDIENLTEGMTYLTILQHKYAVFTHKGTMEMLGETYGYIYGVWLINSEYEIDDAYSYELYDERFNYGDADSEFDIYIPIK